MFHWINCMRARTHAHTYIFLTFLSNIRRTDRATLVLAFTHLAIFSDAEDGIFIIAELHTVNFPIMSSPAHRALIPLHIYRRQRTEMYLTYLGFGKWQQRGHRLILFENNLWMNRVWTQTKQSDDSVSGSSHQQVSIVIEGCAVYGYWFWLQRELELKDRKSELWLCYRQEIKRAV